MKDYGNWYNRAGRPLVLVGECLEHATIRTVEKLWVFRFLSLIFVALAMGSLCTSLAHDLGNSTLAFLIGSSLMLLPGLGFFILQGGAAMMISFGAFLTVTGFLLFRGTNSHAKSLRDFFNWGTLAFFLMMLVALFVYPAIAFLCLLPLLGQILFLSRKDLPKKRTYLVVSFATVVLTAISYVALMSFFIFLKYGTIQSPDLGPGRFQLNPSFLARIPLFIAEISPTVASLWFVHAGTLGMVFLGALWVGGLAIWIWGESKSNSLRQFCKGELLRLAGVACAISGTVSPLILSYAEGATPRRIFVTIASFALINFWLVTLAVRHLPGLLSRPRWNAEKITMTLFAGVWLVAVLQTTFLVSSDVWNSGLEYRFIRDRMESEVGAGRIPARIHFVRTERSLNGKPRAFGEFNTPALAANPEHGAQIVSAVLRDLLPRAQLEKLSLIDCRLDPACAQKVPAPNQILVSQSNPGERFLMTRGILVIDIDAFARSGAQSN
jgi:hypothetical protein